MKISELANNMIVKYGDIEVVEIVHIDDCDMSEPFNLEEITIKSLKRNDIIRPTELITYDSYKGKKCFASINMRGYIDGSIEKALVIDFNRYADDEE